MAQRLALLVLADAVKVVARRPAEQQSPPVERVRAALREEPVEPDEPRVDEQRSRRLDRHDDPLQPERIREDETAVREHVPTARNLVEDIRDREPARAPAQDVPLLAEAADALHELCDRDRERPAGLDRDRELHVVALDVLALTEVAMDAKAPVGEVHPDPGQPCGEQEARSDGIEGLRSERPGGEVDDWAEHEDGAAAPGHTGTGVFSSASCTIVSPLIPLERASGATINRCASTGTATALMSSGDRNSRPSARARALATRSSAIPARGLAPRYRRESERVVRSNATA